MNDIEEVAATHDLASNHWQASAFFSQNLTAGSRRLFLWPIDLITLAYVAIMVMLILVFRTNLGAWQWQATFYGLVGLWVLLLAAVAAVRPSRTLDFLRLWYPILLCVFFFENVGNVVHVVLQTWQDRIPLAIDLATLGVHPTVWLQRLARPWLNDLMQAGYTSYFFLSPALGVWLLLKGRRDRAEESLFGTALTYYGCYLFFVLFPVEGPHHTLFTNHTVELTGGGATSLINWIESFARVHGGALPSAHVAGSTVVLFYAHRYARRLFWILLPAVLCLYAGTVYGRYHYFVDVWTGWIAAAFGIAAALRLHPRLLVLLRYSAHSARLRWGRINSMVLWGGDSKDRANQQVDPRRFVGLANQR